MWPLIGGFFWLQERGEAGKECVVMGRDHRHCVRSRAWHFVRLVLEYATVVVSF